MEKEHNSWFNIYTRTEIKPIQEIVIIKNYSASDLLELLKTFNEEIQEPLPAWFEWYGTH